MLDVGFLPETWGKCVFCTYVLNLALLKFTLCTPSFPLSATMKEVSNDARALGMSAEMNSRRCWAAAVESGRGKERREPTKLEMKDIMR